MIGRKARSARSSFSVRDMLVVADFESAVRDDERVRCAEAILHPAGKVNALFDEHHRIGTDLLGGLDLFENVSGIAGGAVVHFLVVPGQVLGGVLCLQPQRLTQLVLA